MSMELVNVCIVIVMNQVVLRASEMRSFSLILELQKLNQLVLCDSFFSS